MKVILKKLIASIILVAIIITNMSFLSIVKAASSDCPTKISITMSEWPLVGKSISDISLDKGTVYKTDNNDPYQLENSKWLAWDSSQGGYRAYTGTKFVKDKSFELRLNVIFNNEEVYTAIHDKTVTVSPVTLVMPDGTTIDGTPASSNSVEHYIQYNFSGIQPVRSEYTVNFEAEGAKTSIPSQTVNFRGKATKPTEFIYNEDNIHVGNKGGAWYKKDSIYNWIHPYDFNEEVKSDLNLIMRWQTPLVFKSNNTEACSVTLLGSFAENKDYDGPDLLQPNPSYLFSYSKYEAIAYPKEGYKFVGWYFGNKLEDAELLSTNKTLKIDNPDDFYFTTHTSSPNYLWAKVEPKQTSLEIEDIDFGEMYETDDETMLETRNYIQTVKLKNTGDYPILILDPDINHQNTPQDQSLKCNFDSDAFEVPGDIYDGEHWYFNPGENNDFIMAFDWYGIAGDYYATGTVSGFRQSGNNVYEVPFSETFQVHAKVKHPLEKVEEVSPTCESDGNIEYYKCKYCGEKFLDEDATIKLTDDKIKLEKLGHNWSGEAIEIAGDDEQHTRKCLYDNNHTKQESHIYDEGTVTKEPTTTETGIKTYTCLECGHTKQEELPKLKTVDLVDIGNVWTLLDPINEIPFTGEIGPSDKVKLVNETWESTDSLISKQNPGKLQVGKTYKYIAEVEAQNEYIFGESFDFVYGGTSYNYSDLDVTYSTDRKTAYITKFISDKTIEKINIENAEVTGVINKIYNGKEQAQTPVVKLDVNGTPVTLNDKTDYDVTYEKNINAGTATVIITGKGNYTGTIKKEFKIEKISYNMNSVKFENKTVTYDGKAHSIIATGLPQGVKVTYNLNDKVNVGKYEIIATFTGDGTNYNLISSKKAILQINAKDISSTVVSGISNKTYTGKELKQSIVVKDKDVILKEGTDYDVSYKDNKKVGTATVEIKGKGNYTGKISKTFKINPKGTSLSKLKKGKKQFKATWKKQKTQTTGYQIEYSTNKKFKSGNKKVTIKKNKTTSTTVKKLKKNKKYYVRIRTYKTVKGTKYYSGWSKVKNVKVK